MKAIVYQKYGPPEVLTLKDLPQPTPKNKEILVQIHATTVTSGDVRLRASDFPPAVWLLARLMFGLWAPRKQVLGHEFSGVVVAKGTAVTDFEIGDAVFGTTSNLSGGAYAAYIAVPQDGIVA